MSDHGEGLGQRNFWAHVDVATTLWRFVGQPPASTHCHGVDLLAAADRRRPLPILFSAMIEGRLTRGRCSE